ncbi:MAG: glycerate kinase [Akkermansiaceae bacterium]|jgi:glycerate kinase|nr:glycerate kinase [Akkermansiaceae bacterium]
MRILVAPDKFKGSLDARGAAEAMARGLALAHPEAEILIRPMADGGEGFMETVHSGIGGSWQSCPAVDACGREINARFLIAESSDGPIAVMEMAETAGIARLSPTERDPLTASTRGIGMQIAHATENYEIHRIYLGLGGSATNDGGCGMAAALGYRFLDASGSEIPALPAQLHRLARIAAPERESWPEIIAACDVDNPLLGPRGATAVFGPQKGADDAMRPLLENVLARVVEIAAATEAAETPGAGAAGGLGFGLLHFTSARLISGFDLVASLLGFEDLIRGVDLVVTGEGSLDSQSLGGKGPVALAKLAARHGVPTLALCGQADATIRQSGIFHDIRALADSGLPPDILFRDAALLLESLASR